MKQRPEKRLSSGDPLRVDVNVTVLKGYDMSIAAQQQAIRQWLDSGTAPKGYNVEIFEWQNPARKTAKGRKPRKAITADEKTCKKLRRWLQHATLQRVV